MDGWMDGWRDDGERDRVLWGAHKCRDQQSTSYGLVQILGGTGPGGEERAAAKLTTLTWLEL